MTLVTDLLCRYVERWKAHTGLPAAPVVVQCADATTQSGLFCACYVVCEKMGVEGHVSIFHSVKSLRLKQPGVIASLVNQSLMQYSSVIENVQSLTHT